ncbi:MAG: hypothetical protein WA705_21335 [Candidatus Ozemobacteraceae bacterium]
MIRMKEKDVNRHQASIHTYPLATLRVAGTDRGVDPGCRGD